MLCNWGENKSQKNRLSLGIFWREHILTLYREMVLCDGQEPQVLESDRLNPGPDTSWPGDLGGGNLMPFDTEFLVFKLE